MSVKRRLVSRVAALAMSFALAAPALGQDDYEELRRELDALKRGQEQIQQELAELKKVLQQRRPAPSGREVAGKVFDLGANPVKGEPSARLTLIEFMDYQ